MSNLYIEARLQAIKDIASASCSDIKDADNIASFCDEIYSAIPKLDKIIEELELHSFELGTDTLPVHYVRLNEAIEIVKQGGVVKKVVEQMDEKDFCYCHYHDDTYEYFDCLDYMECEECPYYYADEDQVVKQ